MCDDCDWDDAADRAREVAAALPEWKTNRRDFFEELADSIEERMHVTERQLEVIESAEDELS